uniref:PROTEIN/RNA Complex, archaeal, ribosomal, 50S, protein.0A n=1 Tax=Siphoviridae sp. ctLeh52 TaxID=2827849 RepID=A0A8S5RX91_9CAUD|nr:MAG TPA: PROTEIN/RNA Complex, archaeal, ribosomal, 50S, protein.0A [Siphoviridae sp. ctLeh52]
MTENEAIKELETSIDFAKMCIQNNERKNEIQGYEMAIKALEEVQQYRKYKNKFREIYGDCEDALDVMLDLLTKYEMPELNGKADYKLRLLTDKDADKWDAYRQIGTVEECREAVEKQTAKKPTLIDYKKYANFVDNAHFLRDAYWCPNCKQVVRSGSFCDGCGQKLDWSDVE